MFTLKSHHRNAFGIATLLVAALLFCSNHAYADFLSAKPIWPEGRELEKNLSVGFRASFDRAAEQNAWIRITSSTLYRVFLNGEFIGHGPARGPHGFYRVDELDIRPKLKPRLNVVALEVAGYNANSYYLLNQPSFIQAEVVIDGQVVASTAGKGQSFESVILKERIQKVQRYSFQRPFSEVYQLSPGFDHWRTDISTKLPVSNCSVQPTKALLSRRVAYADFAIKPPVQIVGNGEVKVGELPRNPWKDRSLTDIGPKLAGYSEKELVTIPSLEMQGISNKSLVKTVDAYTGGKIIELKTDGFSIADFGCNLTGFIGARVRVNKPTRLFFTFDEILSQGDVDFKRLGCVNIIVCKMEPGLYNFESFEPYTFRFLKMISMGGDCIVENLYLREYVSPIDKDATFVSSDARLNKLYAAGRQTFSQNAVDIFMDCPSRERAGWLCDSYFTSRVAQNLQGHTLIEKCFFENYQLPAKFEFLPEGMLPMCYPADHNDGVFIPNWALWFVAELEEYLARSGDQQLVKALEPRVAKLFDYFKKFKNSDGLLEKLESWVFVEWSKANDFVQDVNYPSNMLYAHALAAAGRMYNRPEWIAEAESIRDAVRKQSFNGEFFVDNALRKDVKLQATQNCSEVCQYFAFYFGIATPKSHPKLWQTLLKDFGPQRKQTKAFPKVHPANAFIGNVLRLELLSRNGLCQQLLDESIAYQLYMADLTGTLWENDGAYASCNHGFASHGGVYVLYRDVLGLANVNTVGKVVQLRFTDIKLDRCAGSVPSPDGKIAMRWEKDGGRLYYQIDVPKGYRVEVENNSHLELTKVQK